MIQTGFSAYEPHNAKWSKLFPYQTMIKMVDQARIVITHGGPSSFIMPLQMGKIPLVVPRKHEFGEHVNDHQVEFCKQVAERYGNIIVIDNIEMLSESIESYDSIVSSMNSDMMSNNAKFCSEFGNMVGGLMK